MAWFRLPKRGSSLLLPMLVLAVTLGMTAFVWDHERQTTRDELRSEFDFALRETVSAIEQRIAAYEQMLRGVQGLLTTTDLTNGAAFADYVKTLQLDANFSGIQVIGIAQRLPAQERSAHEAAMRRSGLSGYAIHPDSKGEYLALVIQREPDIERSRATLGLDLWSDPVRRRAMEKARDSGMAAITGKVQLAIDTPAQAAPSFIMYLPVFARGQPRETLAQRRANLIGWVYAAFHMSDFMASLYGKQSKGLALAIYDDIEPTAAALLYRTTQADSKPAADQAKRLTAREYMVVAGHSWTLTLRMQDEFETRFGRDASTAIAVSGIGLSLSLAWLAWVLVTGRARALRLAAAMTEELRHMAQHDSLTHLPNRALFSDRLAQELARAKRHQDNFALMFLDLDNFKQVNDKLGHAVGDHLLRQVAQRLQASMRAVDTVGRLGGDEFVILMAELKDARAALKLAEIVRTALRQPFLVDGNTLTISCSLGIAVYPQDGSDELSLTKSADVAMYSAKDGGGDRVHFGGLEQLQADTNRRSFDAKVSARQPPLQASATPEPPLNP